MKALQFNGKSIELVELPVPEPGPGEALIRVKLAGICNTDIEITRGYAGFTGTLGHEFVGIVESVRDEGSDWVGKRVVGEINIGCHQQNCSWCGSGTDRHCPNRTVLGILGKNGCMAEYLTLPLRNLLPVPDTVGDEDAVLVEPLAAGFEILEQVHIQPMHQAAIFGDGKLGLLINRALCSSGASIVHVGKHPEKLELASAPGVQTLELENLGNRLFDIVVEATGSVSGFESALAHVRPRGTLVLKTTVSASRPVDLTPVVVNEIQVIGSRCGRFEPALRALKNGLSVHDLIQARYPVHDAKAAFERAKIPGTLKVLLEMG